MDSLVSLYRKALFLLDNWQFEIKNHPEGWFCAKLQFPEDAVKVASCVVIADGDSQLIGVSISRRTFFTIAVTNDVIGQVKVDQVYIVFWGG